MCESEKWVKLLSRVWLSDPMDRSLPGSSIYGIFQQEYWSEVPLPSPNRLVEAKVNNIYTQK